MKKIKGNIGVIGLSICELLLGLLFLISPTTVTSSIIKVIGILFIILGAWNIIKYFRTNPVEALKEQSLAIGLISLTFGLFCVVDTGWFIDAFPIISILYGVGILISGFVKIEWTVDAIRLKIGNAFLTGLSAVLSIIFAIIIIKNPFVTTIVLWNFIGIILIVEAVIDFISVFTRKKTTIEIE